MRIDRNNSDFSYFKSNNYVHFVCILHYEEDTKTIPETVQISPVLIN